MDNLELNSNEIVIFEQSLKKAVYTDLHKEGLISDEDLQELFSKLFTPNHCCS